MKARHLSPILLCGLSILAEAAPLEKPPLPAGPLPARAPKVSEWTIVYRYGADAATEGEDSKVVGNKFTADPFAYTTSRLARSTVSKADGNIHEQFAYENGQVAEKWTVDKLQIAAPPGGKYVRCYGSGSDRYKSDFTKSDFAGFEWISPTNYRGVMKASGMECYVFEDQRQSYEVSDPRDFAEWKACAAPGAEPATPFPSKMVKCVAYVSREQNLPVALMIGSEVRQYIFNPAPLPKLEPQKEAASEFKKWHALLDLYR